MTKSEIVPLVSIGMPVYNGERFIREALDSILTQDFKDFELIISDNASEAALEFVGDNPEFVVEQPEWAFNESRLTENITHWPGAYLKRV